jgi:predicted ester cyclase
MMTEANKTIVRRLVDEVFNGGHLEVIEELYAPELAGAAKRWITPFRASFPDVHMELMELIAEGDKVVARFTCSATHLGDWLGQAPTCRRFERVKEVWILRFRDGRIIHVWIAGGHPGSAAPARPHRPAWLTRRPHAALAQAMTLPAA